MDFVFFFAVNVLLLFFAEFG